MSKMKVLGYLALGIMLAALVMLVVSPTLS